MIAKKALNIGFLGVLALFVAGCEPLEKLISQAVDKQLARRNTDFDSRLTQLEVGQTEVKGKLRALDLGQDIAFSRLNSIDSRKASVTDGAGYGVAYTQHGPILVSAASFQPHLDGYRVTLNVGNPTMIVFSGAEIEVNWGLPWEGSKRPLEEIQKSRKTKKFTFAKDFQAGSYTQIEVALTPAKPDEVKTIDVGIEFNRLSLRRPQPQ